MRWAAMLIMLLVVSCGSEAVADTPSEELRLESRVEQLEACLAVALDALANHGHGAETRQSTFGLSVTVTGPFFPENNPTLEDDERLRGFLGDACPHPLGRLAYETPVPKKLDDPGFLVPLQ